MNKQSQAWDDSYTHEEIVEKFGAWTAMAIRMPDGTHTKMPPQPDYRLRRIVQTAADLVGKPISEMRVLDLACLEAHYAIEFAMHGAQAVGIEIRDQNLAKANYAKEQLKLDNLTLLKDDVRNLSVEKHGLFDLVICSGILYHLTTPDVFEFVKRISDVCTGVAVFDTYIAMEPRQSVNFEGHEYWGFEYREHDEATSSEGKISDLWASIDNTSSFWLTLPSLCNLVSRVGFTSLCQGLVPGWNMEGMIDRQTFFAIKGSPVDILSSEPTALAPPFVLSEKPEIQIHHRQVHRGFAFRLGKKVLPQSVKDTIKPFLRTLGVVAQDGTPDFEEGKND